MAQEDISMGRESQGRESQGAPAPANNPTNDPEPNSNMVPRGPFGRMRPRIPDEQVERVLRLISKKRDGAGVVWRSKVDRPKSLPKGTRVYPDDLVDRMNTNVRARCERDIYESIKLDAKIAEEYGLPGKWAVMAHRKKMKNIAERHAVQMEHDAHKRRKSNATTRVVNAVLWPMEAARQGWELAKAEVEHSQGLQNSDERRKGVQAGLESMGMFVEKYRDGLRLYGEFSGQLAPPGQTLVSGGLTQQTLNVMTLPRLDDPPELVQAAAGALEAGEGTLVRTGMGAPRVVDVGPGGAMPAPRGIVPPLNMDQDSERLYAAGYEDDDEDEDEEDDWDDPAPRDDEDEDESASASKDANLQA